MNKTLAPGKQSEITIEVKDEGKTYVVLTGGIDDWDNDDGGDQPNDDVLFEEPYITWGASVANVQSFMNNNNYEVAKPLTEDEGDWYTIYRGKHKESLIEYIFTSSTSGLVETLVAFDKDNVNTNDVIEFFDQSSKYVFLTSQTEEEGSYYLYRLASDSNTFIYISLSGTYIIVDYIDYSSIAVKENVFSAYDLDKIRKKIHSIK